MKNNKGYTLVELIVAVAVLLVVMAEVGALMVNSQHLYRNGFYELNMQENAQQVIEQVETLLMNANPWNKADRDVATRESVITRSESLAGGVPSDVITIRTKNRDYDINGNATGTFTDVTYVIGRDVDLHPGTAMLGTAGKEYSTLYLQRWEGLTLASDAPMAEGVRSISLAYMTDPDILMGTTTEVKTNYLEADLLTLTVVMQNQQYSYSASSETYLRNQPGTGGPTPPAASVTTGGDLDLNVLRCHTYTLTDLLPPADAGKSWHFKFPDADAASLSSKYNLDDTTKTIKCSSLNSNWNSSVPQAKVYAAQWTDGEAENWTDKKEIMIRTDPVNNDTKLPLYGPSRSDLYQSMFPVTGICVCDSCVNERKLEAQITIPSRPSKMHFTKVEVTEYWPTYTEVVTRDEKVIDQLIIKGINGVGSGCSLKKPDGTAYADGDEFVGFKTDNTFMKVESTSPNPTINLQPFNFQFEPFYSGAHISNPLTGYEVNYIKCPGEGNWAGTYTLRSIKDGTANAFALETSNQCDAAKEYWDTIVSSDGYVRIAMSFTFKNSTPGTYTCYAYLFPKESGSTEQQEKLWGYMLPGGGTP